MICTVTFNPSLDYIVSVDDFQLGMTNRTSSELILPGGKGINVSIVLKNLGLDSTALGYAAGFTGEELIRRLNEFGVNADFIKIDHGMTRINLKLKSIDGTEINGCGPDIDAEALEQLMEKIDRLGDGDVLVLAGSIPYTMPDDIYQRILERIQGRGVLTVVDATRDLLVKVLPYHPFLVKPNNHELGEIFGKELNRDEEITQAARKLQQRGARNVLVSMAGDGALLLDETGAVHRIGTPKGKVVNSVGAGDSMVAGFIAGYLQSGSYSYALRLGTACGSATAFSLGLAERRDIDALLKTIE